MPHLIGVELHEDGIAAAALRPDQTIALRPLDDIARIVARTCAQPWKWSLGVDGRDADAVVAATELFTALRYAMGDEHILAAVAVPARRRGAGHRARRRGPLGDVPPVVAARSSDRAAARPRRFRLRGALPR